MQERFDEKTRNIFVQIQIVSGPVLCESQVHVCVNRQSESALVRTGRYSGQRQVAS